MILELATAAKSGIAAVVAICCERQLPTLFRLLSTTQSWSLWPHSEHLSFTDAMQRLSVRVAHPQLRWSCRTNGFQPKSMRLIVTLDFPHISNIGVWNEGKIGMALAVFRKHLKRR